MYGRSTESVRLFFVDLLAKHMPVVLKRSLEKWFCKIDKWGGPHIHQIFTGGFKGNTMGEVPFAAVLHWVTRIDDFKMLLEDLTERERSVHLVRSEEAAHTFMRWYAQPNDPPEIVAAREIVSDYCCKLFLGQLNMVPLYIASRQPNEGEHCVWHVARLNCASPSFRRLVWHDATPFPFCDDLFHGAVGCLCVHQLSVMVSVGQPLFSPAYFHAHWTRQAYVRVAPPVQDNFQPFQNVFVEQAENVQLEICQSPSPEPTPNQSQQSPMDCLSSQSSSHYHLQDNSPLPPDISIHNPKPKDRVTSGKLLQVFNHICDLTTRPSAKQKGLSQKFYDTLKKIQQELEVSTGQTESGDAVSFNVPPSTTIRTLFSPEQVLATSCPTMPRNSDARPQSKRKRSKHEPPKQSKNSAPSVVSAFSQPEVMQVLI